MSSLTPQFNTTLSLTEMEALIRRVVQAAVHEEFARVLQYLPSSVAENWAHEGEDESAGNELMLAEALAELERYRTNLEEWVNGAPRNAEIAQSEADDSQKRRQFHAELLASGLVKQVKPLQSADRSQRRLIQVRGKPVSQTLIEERR